MVLERENCPHLSVQFKAEVDALTAIPRRNSDLKFNSKRLSAVDFSLTKVKPSYLNTTRTLSEVIGRLAEVIKKVHTSSLHNLFSFMY